MTLVYLSIYNAIQLALWSLGLLLLGAWALPKPDSLDLYICMAQSMMVLDIVHVALGLTREDFNDDSPDPLPPCCRMVRSA